jgi:hypothetical protein
MEKDTRNKAEGRRQRAEGRGQRAEGRGQRAENFGGTSYVISLNHRELFVLKLET